MKFPFLISLFVLLMSTLSGNGFPAHVLLQSLEQGIKGDIEAEKGMTRIAHDPAEVLDFLKASAPQGWRVILALDAETAVERKAQVGVSETAIVAIVQRPVGLSANPSAQALNTLEIAEFVRSLIRGLKLRHAGLDSCYGFSWRSSNWIDFKEDGKPPVFARQHNFEVVHLIQRPAEMPEQPVTYIAGEA